jgi:hypothetical protein
LKLGSSLRSFLPPGITLPLVTSSSASGPSSWRRQQQQQQQQQHSLVSKTIVFTPGKHVLYELQLLVALPT